MGFLSRLPFFGGEFNFTAEFVCQEHDTLKSCETVIRIKASYVV